MAAPTSYPSWIYNSTQLLALVIDTVEEFDALPGPGQWTTTPFVVPPADTPSDPGFIVTDQRLQQILIESRVANLMLSAGLLPGAGAQDEQDDVTGQDAGLGRQVRERAGTFAEQRDDLHDGGLVVGILHAEIPVEAAIAHRTRARHEAR